MAAEDSSPGEEFVRLCRQGDLEAVKAALLAGVDVNSKESWSGYTRTGLIWALIGKHNDVVQHLLNIKDLNIHLKDCQGTNVLHAAVIGHNHEGLAMLLACHHLEEMDLTLELMLNARDKYRRTPLWRAVENFSYHCMNLLLADDRVDPNIEAYQGPECPGQGIIDVGCVTALVFAVKRGTAVEWALGVPLLRCLLKNPRTDPNTSFTSFWSKTALMYAVKENKEEIARILLADPRVDLDTTGLVYRKDEDIAR